MPRPANRTPDIEQFSISAHFSRLVAREIGARGKQLDLLLRGTDIDPQQFMHGELMLSAQQETIFAHNARRLSHDDGLGLRIGKLLTPEAYGPLGFLVSSSPDLHTAIEHFKTFLPSYIPFVALETGIDDTWLNCRLEIRLGDDPWLRRAIQETISLSLLSIIENIVGKHLGRGMLFCGYPAPDYAARYAQYFSVPVHFDAPSTCLRVGKELAATPNPIASKANYAQAVKLCRSMLDQLKGTRQSTTNRVKQILLSGPPNTIGEQEIAASLFMSRRTLARRLSRENTGLKAIQAEILASIAVTQLQETNDTVESIAALLNYYDSSNFRRAFRSWLGMTPDEFRRKHRGQRRSREFA